MWVGVAQALPKGKTCTEIVNTDSVERVTEGYTENGGALSLVFTSGRSISIMQDKAWWVENVVTKV